MVVAASSLRAPTPLPSHSKVRKTSSPLLTKPQFFFMCVMEMRNRTLNGRSTHGLWDKSNIHPYSHHSKSELALQGSIPSVPGRWVLSPFPGPLLPNVIPTLVRSGLPGCREIQNPQGGNWPHFMARETEELWFEMQLGTQTCTPPGLGTPRQG